MPEDISGIAAKTITGRSHADTVTFLSVPSILTACLTCGWVHGPPWRCQEMRSRAVTRRQNVRGPSVRREKPNTLRMTPNDWSTLSNGTLAGTPTGLRRYVGEQRFVFALLNVTDGHGNLASYDLEAKEPSGRYTDFSGNGIHAIHFGDPAVPARFGLAAKLDGTANSYIYASDDAKFNTIDGALTVAFWIRPDADYVSQAGWSWSFGRQDLWRVGFANGKLRFEVTHATTPFPVRAVETPYPLYAGRWYHVSAVMERVFDVIWYTKLTLYVNGVVAAECGCTDTTARDGTTWLYLGTDTAGGGRFKGVVDEFRLYTTALTQDAIRGLQSFLKGSNNVLLPRGVFFDSKLYASLNASSLDPNAPFAGATVYGNDNKGIASLNSRIIQMVIAKNATLAQASKVLDLAATNKSNIATAFPLPVTDEWYTLGLAREVDDLAANAAGRCGNDVH